MKKNKLFKRLSWAFKAFKSGPVPSLADSPPLITVHQYRTKRLRGSAKYYWLNIPEHTERLKIGKEIIAKDIGLLLLREGLIKFTDDPMNMELVGEVYVSAPEEDC